MTDEVGEQRSEPASSRSGPPASSRSGPPATGQSGPPGRAGGRSRGTVAWVLVFVTLACGALAGAAASERYEKRQVRQLVAARAQVERFGDHDTYLLIWNDQIFANVVPIPEGWLASLPEGARLRVFYSPVTQQVVLRSRRYDAPQTLLALAVALLVAATALPLRELRRARRSAVAAAAVTLAD